MTKDERKNRNPAVEYSELKTSELRELSIADLVLHKVYILVGNARGATLNYMGTVTDGVDVAYHFFGPRAGFHAYLAEALGIENAGKLVDGSGNRITLYEYTGPDA